MRPENSGNNMAVQKFTQMQVMTLFFGEHFFGGSTFLVQTVARGIKFLFLVARYKIKLDNNGIDNFTRSI